MDKMLTVTEAAELAGVSISLVYEWCSAGVLVHFRLGAPGKRGCIRIRRADLERFLSSCVAQPPEEKLKHIS